MCVDPQCTPAQASSRSGRYSGRCRERISGILVLFDFGHGTGWNLQSWAAKPTLFQIGSIDLLGSYDQNTGCHHPRFLACPLFCISTTNVGTGIYGDLGLEAAQRSLLKWDLLKTFKIDIVKSGLYLRMKTMKPVLPSSLLKPSAKREIVLESAVYVTDSEEDIRDKRGSPPFPLFCFGIKKC